jgi:hypothetical protein
MNRFTRANVILAFALLVLPIARAEYITGFEELLGSAGGELLTGQDGYYLPVTGSTDFLVYTYEGNALGLPQNPTGEDQFIGCMGPGNSVYGRAQRDLSFDVCPVWVIAWDFAATYLGVAPSAQNVGSFSIRNEPLAISHYIHLFTWVDPDNPTLFNAFYLGYDAGGTQFLQPGETPGFMWMDLSINHWYRAWTKVDLAANMIVECGIMDLSTGMFEVQSPVGWYLVGGSAGAAGPPLSIRFFAGTSTISGNTTAFDNVDIHPEPPSPVEPMSWGQIKSLYR